jgi:hypothetical protein
MVDNIDIHNVVVVVVVVCASSFVRRISLVPVQTYRYGRIWITIIGAPVRSMGPLVELVVHR